MTAAKIIIEDLALNLRIGILDAEKTAPQRVLVSMDLDLAPDYLQTVTKDTIVDYGKICAALQSWEDEPHTDLLETLARKAADLALSYEMVTTARIHIRKPDIIPMARSVGVEIVVGRG